jgi:hypothetical protein
MEAKAAIHRQYEPDIDAATCIQVGNAQIAMIAKSLELAIPELRTDCGQCSE